MIRLILTLFVLISGVASLAAQAASPVYRWVDEKGAVHYTDQPPPPKARQSSTLSGKPNVIETEKESYETRQARASSPVVLYANVCGPLCEEAVAFLRQRGIPFSQKDPSKDLDAAIELKKLAGALEVPVIVVGAAHLKGFEPGAWNNLLDAAGYPRAPLLPVAPR